MSTVSSRPETVEFAGVDGITLVADEWNRGSDGAGRPSILMFHGGGQNRFSWKNTGQTLAAIAWSLGIAAVGYIWARSTFNKQA